MNTQGFKGLQNQFKSIRMMKTSRITFLDKLQRKPIMNGVLNLALS